MVDIVTTGDLPSALQSAELVDVMVAGANAKAARIAPCLVDTDPEPSADQLAEAKLVLIGAIKRWAEAGAGSAVQQTAGPFGMTVDTRQRTGYNFWPSEIGQLQDICRSDTAGKAFTIKMGPDCDTVHLPWCSTAWGADCSCGADIAGWPIYEDD